MVSHKALMEAIGFQSYYLCLKGMMTDESQMDAGG
jgi:hypothetical protein